MNITSNLTSIKNFISELPRTNLGSLGGRVVTFIRGNGLLFGIAAGVSIAAFFYFRSKQTPIAPKDGQIIGSRLNYTAPIDSSFEETKRNSRRVLDPSPVLCPSEIMLSDCEVICFEKNIVVNHTKHYVDIDKSNNLFLDGFYVINEPQNIRLSSFKNRQDLICTLNTKNLLPETLIFLEKVNKQFVISWTTDAQDFGWMPDESEKNKYTFIFSMAKIDDAINGKRVGAFLSLTWDHSAFASIPRDVLNHIVKSL